MIILLSLLFLVILLVYIAISNSLLYIALRLVTGEKIGERKLILPSFLNFILLILFIIASYFILSSISIKGISVTFMNLLFKTTSFSDIFFNAILPMILMMVICFILSTFALLTVNIDYDKVKGNIRFFFKKLFKKKNKNNEKEIINNNLDDTIVIKNNNNIDSHYNDSIVEETSTNLGPTLKIETINYDVKEKSTDEILNTAVAIKKENVKITYLNSLVANIFIISLIIFTFTIFFSAGYLLSDTIMKML